MVGAEADHGPVSFALQRAYPEGLTAHTACTSDEALRLLDDLPVYCVLVAIDPDGDSPADLARHIRARHPGMPLVLVADPLQGRVVEDAIDDGAHDVVWRSDLTSPILRETITRARERAHAHFVERRMARVMERSSDVVLVLDADGAAGYVSESFEEVTGFAAGSPERRTDLELTHPDDAAIVRRAIERVRHDGEQNVSVEFRGRHGDGTWHWREMDVTNLLDDPLVNGIVLNIRDVNDRRRADEAVRFRSKLIQSVGQPIIATDADMRVQFWNQAAVDVFGWRADEAVGRPIRELVANDQQWESIGRAVRDNAGRESWSGDYRLSRKDGSTFPAHVTNTRLLDEYGHVIGNIGATTDLTEHMRSEERQLRLSAIVESSLDAIASVDLDGTVISWNSAATALHGRRPGEVVGLALEELKSRYGIDLGLEESLRRMGEGGPLSPLRVVTHPANNPRRHCANYFSPIHDASGRVTAVSVVTRDITEQVELVQRLETDRRRMAEAQRTAHLGSFELDTRTAELIWSDELYDILGVHHDVSPNEDMYRDRIHPDDLPWAEPELLAVFTPGTRTEVVHRIVRLNDGCVRWVTARAAAGEDGVVHGTVYDMTELKEAELELAYRAHHDPLTGLPNRSWFGERLEQLVTAASRHDEHVTVALLDLDQFKVINDSLGHAAGDRVLEALATRITRGCHDTDVLGRFGGDEFVVARTGRGDPAAEAAVLGSTLHMILRDPLDVDGRRFHLTASIGITTSDPGATPISLLRDADTAMYEAKAQGKDRFVHFDDALRARSRRRLELEADLHRAIEREQLAVHYQPVTELASARTVGFEALLRWEHPVLGTIEPTEFVPIAEDSGLIVSIGEWVLCTAARQLARWRTDGRAGPDNWMAVNLSTRQLGSGDVVDTVRRVLDETDLPAANLHLEVTESLLLDHATHGLDFTHGLADLGVPLSIDDFGTGYSSLSYLRRLPVSTLKVDRSFVAGIGRDAQDTAIATTIIELAHGLGMTVVAEGVEDEVQLAALRALGCEFGQGYLWARPLPAERAQEWLPCLVR